MTVCAFSVARKKLRLESSFPFHYLSLVLFTSQDSNHGALLCKLAQLAVVLKLFILWDSIESRQRTWAFDIPSHSPAASGTEKTAIDDFDKLVGRRLVNR